MTETKRTIEEGSRVKVLTDKGELKAGSTTTVTYICPAISDYAIAIKGCSKIYSREELALV